MARFKLALGSGATDSGLIAEVRQRLLTGIKSGTDAGLADDDAIKRRLNLRYQRWCAELAQMGMQELSKDLDFAITAPDTTYTLPDDFMSVWNVYRYSNAAKTSKTPVTIISPRDEDKYTAPLLSLGIDESAPRKFMAYITQQTLHFVVRGSSNADIAGNYQLRYYYYPDELSNTTDETELPPQLDEVLIADVVASLAADSGRLNLQAAQTQVSRQLLRDFWQMHVKRNRTSNRRIKDVMGYRGNNNRFGGSLWR